jgi:hypothetical protein
VAGEDDLHVRGSAGDGIGMPRCWVVNATACPLDCKIGMYALR